MENSTKWIVAIVAIVLVFCLCMSVLCIGGAGLIIYRVSQSTPVPFGTEDPFGFPEIPTFEPFSDLDATPTPFSGPVPTLAVDPPTNNALETQRTLEENLVPENDLIELAERFEGKQDIQLTLPPPTQPLEEGDRETFWATDLDTDENFEIDATLRYVGENIYFWIEDSVRYDNRDLEQLAQTFDEEIVPTNRKFFGLEWSPGIDSDPRLYVLYATGLGSNVAGYFSSNDSFPPEAVEYSNGHEMFFLSADNVDLGEEYIYGTMAHEYQHMIHFANDRNEEGWVNEGFSMLSELLNGYDAGGFDYLFLSDPDLQLNTWPDFEDSTPHYGASYLFFTYFLDKYGDEATQALVKHEENGMESIDLVLDELNAVDPTTGEPVRADDVFRDWTVANYVADEEVAGGRYFYSNYPGAPTAYATEEYSACPVESQSRTVNQYGADYISFTCDGSYTLEFNGSTEVGLLPTDPYSGEYAFWSNKGDESHMSLWQEFDLTQASGDVTLAYRTWYDIEEGYDYVYLAASTDGGETWEIIETPSGTDEDPSGNSYGWGYNGTTDVYILEEVDLSDYAGKKVILSFEYITDAAVNGQGFLLDDVSIPAINYQSDFETDDGGWTSEGFVRVTNHLPQTFIATLIKYGDETTVEPVALDDLQRGSVTFEVGGDVREVVLVVSGTTRHTNQPGAYQLSVR